MLNIIKKLIKSAFHAIHGVIDTFREEIMMRFQFFYGMTLVFLSFIFRFEIRDIVYMFFVWIALLSVELVNTAIENSVDLFCDNKKDIRAKRAKDCAAAASLMICLGALISFISFFIINFSK